MRNTRIPLDIIFLDARGHVVTIKQMQPYDLTSVSSDRPIKFAIELNQGQATAAGLQTGAQVQIPPHISDSAR
jgi:uncharacterized membrane protein (UPF0127 family)